MSLLENLADYVRVPVEADKIFKDECPFDFETAELSDGVYICLKYFIAVGAKHVREYYEKTGCYVFMQYKIKKQFKPKDPSVDPHPKKLALGVPGGFELPQDRYTITEHWALVAFPEPFRLELPNPSADQPKGDLSHLKHLNLPTRLATTINAIQRADSALLIEERASGVAAWEDDNLRVISAHAMDLVQLDNGVRIAPSGWKCSQCDLKENLWLNLTDGSINCGRRFWDGSGGNNHAVDHYKQTGYPLAVKLGTITPEGAEVYSYAEDEMVLDPLLAEHLAHFGIDIMLMEKTEKTLAELEVTANEKLGEWCLLQESNRELAPRYGPGMTGLRNLGNTCYMNAVVQVLFAIPQFRWLYAYQNGDWIARALSDLTSSGSTAMGSSNNPVLPIDNVGLQFAKLGHGLCSGAYSWLAPANLNEIQEGPVPLLPGIRPQLFRRLMGRHNATFASKHQQDAFEFLIFLLDLLDTKACSANGIKPAHACNAQGQPVSVPYPSSCLRLAVENRLECGLTHKVQYSTNNEVALSVPIPLEAMINRAEYEEYEKKRQEADAAGVKLDPETRVRPLIPLEACISAWAQTERIEDFRTPASVPPRQKTFAFRSCRLANFPDYLCIQLAKYTVGSDWLPRKLDVEIELNPTSVGGNETTANYRINLAGLRSSGGLQPGEEPMTDPDEPLSTGITEPTEPAQLEPNTEYMNALMAMGFSSAACHRACVQTSNASLEAATNWIMEHLDDPNLNDPVPLAQRPASAPRQSAQPQVDESSVEMMMAMGFTRTQAVKALRHTNNNLEAAADWAFSNPSALDEPEDEPMLMGTVVSGDDVTRADPTTTETTPLSQQLTDGSSVYELCAFISHMGSSTTDGHYVAHIKRSSLAKSVPYEVPVQHLGSPPCEGNDDEWIIFNDEKVAKSEAPPHRHAYIYFFRRLDAPCD